MVLGLYNIHLGGQQEEDEYIVEMVLDPEVLEELIKEEEKQLEENNSNFEKKLKTQLMKAKKDWTQLLS